MTRPGKSRVSASRWAAASSMVVWPSWPQACILPGTVEAHSAPVSSMIGRASMSARRPMARPDLLDCPRITPTTPVRPIPSTTSSTPASRRAAATLAAVACTS